MSGKNVHSGHRQRLRDRAAAEGFEEFNPHQIMELLLFYAIPRQDTSEIAHLLIERFGSLQGVFGASQEELMTVEGVGKRVADWLKRVGELVDAYGDMHISDKLHIQNYAAAFRFCLEQEKRMKKPCVYFAALTPAGVVQLFDRMCDGLAWGESDVLKHCLNDVLAVHARNVIVVEFMDGPELKPSEYDLQKVNEFATTLRLVGAELLDVILVSNGEALSLEKAGFYSRKDYGEARSYVSENYLREDDVVPPYDEQLPLTDDGL